MHTDEHAVPLGGKDYTHWTRTHMVVLAVDVLVAVVFEVIW